MGTRKGAARVGACLVPLEAGGGGAFSHDVQIFFGAHALVARVIANMLIALVKFETNGDT